MGAVNYCREPFWPHNTTLYVTDFLGNDPLFAYFLLGSIKFRSYDSGSAQASLNRNFIYNIHLWVPPIEEQRAIAHILGTLNEKIDLLRRMNLTLEETCRTLFRSWFIDFDPVQAKIARRKPEGLGAEIAKLFPTEFQDSALGPIPKGWTVGAVGDFVTVHGGSTPRTTAREFWDGGAIGWATPKDLSGLTSPVLLSTARLITNAGLAQIGSGLLPSGTLLMSSRAPIGYLAIAQMPVAVNQGFAAIPPGGRLSPTYMLFWIQHHMDQIKARAGGTTFPEISKASFRSLPMVAPESCTVERFDKVAGGFLTRIAANEQHALTIAETRDTLLPKLLSGALRIPDPDRFLKEAGV
jgi:type I restriction enzyme S subunit